MTQGLFDNVPVISVSAVEEDIDWELIFRLIEISESTFFIWFVKTKFLAKLFITQVCSVVFETIKEAVIELFHFYIKKCFIL